MEQYDVVRERALEVQDAVPIDVGDRAGCDMLRLGSGTIIELPLVNSGAEAFVDGLGLVVRHDYERILPVGKNRVRRGVTSMIQQLAYRQGRLE